MDNNIKLLIIGISGFLVLVVLIIGAIALLGSSFGGTIAVIPINGEIAYGQSNILGGDVVNPEVIKEQLKQADADSSVSAIVLDINSPGGTPVASEEIMNAIKKCDKPVVAWISDTGASGAYLLASAADKIVASRSSWVGSIGVILDITNLSDLYKKLGIDKYAIKGGKYKDMGADYRNLTAEEKAMLQKMVDDEHDNFISIVAENRKLDKNYVKSIAEGQVFTGAQAKELKLIDETGSKDDALDTAAKMAGISGSYEVITMTPPQSFNDFLNTISSKIGYSIGKGIGSLIQEDTLKNALY
ncbi:MAG: signal peptide peptidase SppA [Methanobacterium sp.]|uniref:signal peptide peptidase SppA n=1 Tax=Methanobacterium sp. TaxID=2164 RepID=UPI003D6604EA|nr:signal peptide peptidase SppA [Methanobacterium sp.]